MANANLQPPDFTHAELGVLLNQLDADRQKCVRECLDCFAACEQTIAGCLRKGGRHAAFEHIRALLDCAESCHTAVSMMMRQSVFQDRQCDLCADLCDSCADSCERLADDRAMRVCADICRRCASICRRMSRTPMQ
jgi:hypothetical protein